MPIVFKAFKDDAFGSIGMGELKGTCAYHTQPPSLFASLYSFVCRLEVYFAEDAAGVHVPAFKLQCYP